MKGNDRGILIAIHWRGDLAGKSSNFFAFPRSVTQYFAQSHVQSYVAINRHEGPLETCISRGKVEFPSSAVANEASVV